MSRIKRLMRPEVQSINWKTAVTVFGVTAICVGMVAHASVPERMVNTNATSAVSPVAKNTANNIENGDSQSNTSVDQNKSKTVPSTAPKRTSDKSNSPSNVKAVLTSGRIDFEAPGCRPDYPRLALRNELTGMTTLQVEGTSDGKIGKVSVVKSSGHALLDDAVSAQLTSGKCLLVPPKLNGVPQKTNTQVQYIWKLDVYPVKKEEKLSSEPIATNSSGRIDFERSGCKPEYPRASLRNEETGTTGLLVKVDERGVINNVSVTQSSGFRGLDVAIYEKLKAGSCIAIPAHINGEAQASTFGVQYVWMLD